MLHLCIPQKDGHEVHVPVNEYTQFIASWMVGAYLTNEKRDRHTMLWFADEALSHFEALSENRVNRGRRMDAVTKIRTFVQKELSCLKTSV